ncbi:hypothetical protein N0V90_011030 [Kalmusia sp. IMI 367209]|nr:hypothetical protein N0V90_011030 [Kalmusia sp. IMI 367209]
MAHEFNTTDFVSQMKGFQASDDARQKLFARSVDQMERQVAETQRELFQDALLQAAAHDGGSEAASRLQHAVRDHIASLYGNSGNWPIMVQIYLSLDKLAQKLASVNLIQKPSDLRTFAQGFSLNQSLFTIVDVGHGKERADHKIKVKAARITLLESTPAWRGFVELPNFKRTSFDEVFRNTPLPDFGTTSYSHAPVQPPISAPIQHMTRTMASPSPPPGFRNPPPGFPAAPPGFSNSMHGTPTISSPATTVSSLAANPTPEPGEASWATVGKSGNPPNENISIAPKTKSNKKWAYYNKDGYRLDEPLPPRDKTASDAIDIRMKKGGKNLCNHWHLNRDLGHQCSFEREQGYCPFPDTCNLRATHGMDKEKATRWDEFGEQEDL